MGYPAGRFGLAAQVLGVEYGVTSRSCKYAIYGSGFSTTDLGPKAGSPSPGCAQFGRGGIFWGKFRVAGDALKAQRAGGPYRIALSLGNMPIRYALIRGLRQSRIRVAVSADTGIFSLLCNGLLEIVSAHRIGRYDVGEPFRRPKNRIGQFFAEFRPFYIGASSRSLMSLIPLSVTT